MRIECVFSLSKPARACRPAVKLGGEGAELTRRREVVFGEDRYEVTLNSAIDAGRHRAGCVPADSLTPTPCPFARDSLCFAPPPLVVLPRTEFRVCCLYPCPYSLLRIFTPHNVLYVLKEERPGRSLRGGQQTAHHLN